MKRTWKIKLEKNHNISIIYQIFKNDGIQGIICNESYLEDYKEKMMDEVDFRKIIGIEMVQSYEEFLES